MRVERISDNKVRIFISYEDLEERGIGRDEIWQNGRKIQELFWDMMEKAYVEVGFEVMGPIAVEAFTMPTEGVMVVVTQVSALPDEDEEHVDDEPIVSDREDSPGLCYVFQDFEEAVQAAHALRSLCPAGGKLVAYNARFHLYFSPGEIDPRDEDAVAAVLGEYGERSKTTPAMLEEYGTVVFPERAVDQLCERFPLKPSSDW